MPEVPTMVLLFLLSYLIGSIPVAWILTWLIRRQDLRKLGSGNVGVMNVAVSVARWAGLLVFLTEAAKGIAVVSLMRAYSAPDWAVGLAVLAAVIGTRWSLWLGFAGGRGNTVGAAALLLISWPALVIGLGLWFLARFVTGTSFRATRISLLAFPFLLGGLTQSWSYFLFGIAFSLVYLNAQRPETDDHLIIKGRWHSLGSFLKSPPRGRQSQSPNRESREQR